MFFVLFNPFDLLDLHLVMRMMMAVMLMTIMTMMVLVKVIMTVRDSEGEGKNDGPPRERLSHEMRRITGTLNHWREGSHSFIKRARLGLGDDWQK